MRRLLPVAAVLLAVAAAPAQAHDSLTAARLGAEVQVALAHAGIQPASPAAPRAAGPRVLKLVVMPIQITGVPDADMPSLAQLQGQVAALNAIYAANTGTGLRATAVYAPTYHANDVLDPYDSNGLLAKAIAAAVANGVKLGGATPVFIGASNAPQSSYGGPSLGALLLGPHWKMASVWAHEIGHWMGLSHGRSPGCATPGAVQTCSEVQGFDEYGDFFDIMGSGADRFGAFQLRVLGLQTTPDAPAVPTVSTIAPPGKPGPAGLRVRTAKGDWFFEARSESHEDVFSGFDRFDLAQMLPAGGVIASRAPRRYTIDKTGYFPNPYRYAPAVGVPCDPLLGVSQCGALQVFMPGTSLTVPGTFKLDVLPAAVDGTSQVRTTWLDPSPPVLASLKGRREKAWGATSTTLVLDLVGSASGAGITGIDVKAAGKTKRTEVDLLTDLVAGKGKAQVRLKAPRSGAVEVTLVDAAGHRSSKRRVLMRKTKLTRPPALTMTPRGGNGFYTAPTLATGTKLRVAVRTDPKTRGIPVYVWVLGGTPSAYAKQAAVSRTGKATVVVALPKGELQVVVQVPRKKGRVVTWTDQPRAWYHVG